MADVVKVTKSKLDALANALRAKKGTSEPLTLQEMIADIPALAPPEPGTYDANGNLLKTWNQLIADGDVTVTNGVLSTPDDRATRFTNVEKVVIDPSVTSVGEMAFGRCEFTTTITIPDGVTNIGESAFFECVNLTTITIPDGVTNIGKGAFNGCMSLTTITIPDSVTNIGEYVFFNCSKLTTIHYSGTATGAPWSARNATVVP